LNLRLVRTTDKSIDWGAKSNFGASAMGAAVAVGGVADTASPPGSVGTIKGEHRHLVYESLSGKTYASIVTFEGDGRPSGVKFLSKELLIAESIVRSRRESKFHGSRRVISANHWPLGYELR
jgi:hypothetical protein